MTIFFTIVGLIAFAWFFGPSIIQFIDSKRSELEVRLLTRQAIKQMNRLTKERRWKQ